MEGQQPATNIVKKSLAAVVITDPAVHHHAARAAGPHPARPRGEELAGAGQGPAGGPLQADARRGGEREYISIYLVYGIILK